jgi:hypothetical protein
MHTSSNHPERLVVSDTIEFTLVPLQELPCPGLGKGDYPELETAMKHLLGDDWHTPSVNRQYFHTERYQKAIAEHLQPWFQRDGEDIVEVAGKAAQIAETSKVFRRKLSLSGGHTDYLKTLPPEIAPHVLDSWVRNPPHLVVRPGQTLADADYVNGRHRVSLLRYRIETQQPDFPVLVKIEHSAE